MAPAPARTTRRLFRALLVRGGDRRIGVVAFSELVSQSLREVPGLEIFDLEEDADVFEFDLPRVRIIPLDEFDPTRYL